MKKFIFPLIVVIIIIALVVVSKFSQKPSGKDLYISFEEEETSEDDKYVDGVYESVVKPNFEVKVDDSGNKTVITNDSEVSINEKDKEILIKNSEGNIEVVKVADLLGDHSPTNDNTSYSDDFIPTEDNSVKVAVIDHLGDIQYTYLPADLAYDTDLIERNGRYVGMLYGKYAYSIPKDVLITYNIDKSIVISSYSTELFLGRTKDERQRGIYLSKGIISYRGSLDNSDWRGDE